jgi:capsular polysaccharide biosynthesis protein
MPALVELLRRRWWVIVTVAVLAVGAAGAYALRQGRVYESTETLYIHPSQASISQGTPAVVSGELGLLSYGSMVNTFVSIAQSRSTMNEAASTLGIAPDRLKRFTAIATVPAKSFVLSISVDGPDRRILPRLDSRLSQTVANTVSADFPIVALSTLDAGSMSSQIRPRVRRDLVYGALAGLILGFVAAVLSMPTGSKTAKLGIEGGDGTRATADAPAGAAADAPTRSAADVAASATAEAPVEAELGAAPTN